MRCEHRQKVYVPDEELPALCPAIIRRNVLPKELADSLLDVLMRDCVSWTSCR